MYNGLSVAVPYAWRGGSITRPHDLVKTGELLGPATVGAFAVTLDLDAIVCLVAD